VILSVSSITSDMIVFILLGVVVYRMKPWTCPAILVTDFYEICCPVNITEMILPSIMYI
jgi:hypothetical protein